MDRGRDPCSDAGSTVSTTPGDDRPVPLAAAAGIWTDPHTHIDYPRLQLFTLAELFQGRQPKVPHLDRQAGFRKAKREDQSQQGSLL